MESEFQLTTNGQQVTQADLNNLGTVAALDGDRVFAELFRMVPFDGSTVSRGILPYGTETSANVALVAPNGASGNVTVSPFRAFIGSRTTVGTDAKANWRDIRCAVAVGTTTLAQTVAIAANASGNPRWDLVYALVSIGANETTATRKIKSPTTKVISSSSVVTTTVDKVTLGALAGTPAASPVFPATPADSGSNYYIPLAYVRVPSGFGATSTVLTTGIAAAAPILRMPTATGCSMRVCDSLSAASTAQQQAWGSSGTRPKWWLPPDITGTESLFVFLDLHDASSANWSHRDGDVIDSRDWRGRLIKWTAQNETFVSLPWSTADGSSSNLQGNNTFIGIAQSLYPNVISGGLGISRTEFAILSLGSVAVVLAVDWNDGGKLKLHLSTTNPPDGVFSFWLDFTGPYTNK